jgi:hypothetical protein
MVAAKLANMRQGSRTDLKEPSATLPEVSQAEAANMLHVPDRQICRTGRFPSRMLPNCCACRLIMS